MWCGGLYAGLQEFCCGFNWIRRISFGILWFAGILCFLIHMSMGTQKKKKIHMSIIWIYVISSVQFSGWPASCLAGRPLFVCWYILHGKNFLHWTFHINFSAKFFLLLLFLLNCHSSVCVCVCVYIHWEAYTASAIILHMYRALLFCLIYTDMEYVLQWVQICWMFYCVFWVLNHCYSVSFRVPLSS